jgi:hypothetical protein
VNKLLLVSFFAGVALAQGAPAPAPDKTAPAKAALDKIPPAPGAVAPALKPAEPSGPHPADKGFLRWRGPHPVAAKAGGGFCQIGRLHFHPYEADPAQELHTFKRRDVRSFIGDPVAFGYDGNKFAYHHHHPLPAGAGLCFIDGPHWHASPPPGGYKKVEEVSFYVSKLPASYHELRKEAAARTKYYKDAKYERPKAVTPPPEWTTLWTPILQGKPLPPEAVGPAPGALMDRGRGLPMDQAALRERLKLHGLGTPGRPAGTAVPAPLKPRAPTTASKPN